MPYCSLYDQGYTSLGDMATTQKNPALEREDGSFAPAYELKQTSEERLGRSAKPSKQSSSEPTAEQKADGGMGEGESGGE
jgi:FAD synthetase